MLQPDAHTQPWPCRHELLQQRAVASSWAGARLRRCARRRQLHGGPAPLRIACQSTAAEDGSALPCTRQADPEQLRDPAMIGGSATSGVHVQDVCGSESLDAYMRLPPEAYSQLMPGMIVPLGGNRFLLRLPRISFFKVWVAPEVEVQARLVEGTQPCVRLESCACRLPGSPLFASLEGRFALRFRTELSWSPAAHSAGTAGDAAARSGAQGDGAGAAAAGGAPANKNGNQHRSSHPLALPRGLAGLFGQRSSSQAEPPAAASDSDSKSGDSDLSREAALHTLASVPGPQPSSSSGSSNSRNGSSGSNGSGGSNASNGSGDSNASNGSGGGCEGAAWDASLAAPSLLDAELAPGGLAGDELGASSPALAVPLAAEGEAEGNSRTSSSQERQDQGHIYGDLVLEVWSEVPPPLHLLPRSVVEGTGNAVLRGLIRTLLPLFMRRLGEDYELWAKDPAYRESKAEVAALGRRQVAGSAGGEVEPEVVSSPGGEVEPEGAGEAIAR